MKCSLMAFTSNWVELKAVPTQEERLVKLENVLGKFVKVLSERLGIKIE